MTYYNDNDPKVCAWLAELVKQGLLPAGDVDCKSITEVRPDELTRYAHVHFFAGIGGWAYALRLAGWPDDRPVWTGSCPCQPFSAAGKRKGHADERHLWPTMFRLIRECKPSVVFGEQVEGAVRLGWLDGVFADLEGEGYACGSAVLGAHSVGSPHIRQRLFWLADARPSQARDIDARSGVGADQGKAGRREECVADQLGRHLCFGGLGDADNAGLEGRRLLNGARAGERTARPPSQRDGAITISTGGLGNASSRGCEQGYGQVAPRQRCPASHWSNAATTPCGDGKSRRIEPGTPPLAHGLPARVVRLRGYGNAIVPQVAAEFVAAYLEVVNASPIPAEVPA